MATKKTLFLAASLIYYKVYFIISYSFYNVLPGRKLKKSRPFSFTKCSRNCLKMKTKFTFDTLKKLTPKSFDIKRLARISSRNRVYLF